MIVNKLTLTPWISGGSIQTFAKPTEQMAATLLKERLSLGANDNTTARIFKKIPKSLRGFVNPKCKVSCERKFSMDV